MEQNLCANVLKRKAAITVSPNHAARTYRFKINLSYFYFISFAKENKTFNVTKLKNGVRTDTATAEANYSGPG